MFKPNLSGAAGELDRHAADQASRQNERIGCSFNFTSTQCSDRDLETEPYYRGCQFTRLQSCVTP